MHKKRHGMGIRWDLRVVYVPIVFIRCCCYVYICICTSCRHVAAIFEYVTSHHTNRVWFLYTMHRSLIRLSGPAEQHMQRCNLYTLCRKINCDSIFGETFQYQRALKRNNHWHTPVKLLETFSYYCKNGNSVQWKPLLECEWISCERARSFCPCRHRRHVFAGSAIVVDVHPDFSREPEREIERKRLRVRELCVYAAQAKMNTNTFKFQAQCVTWIRELGSCHFERASSALSACMCFELKHKYVWNVFFLSASAPKLYCIPAGGPRKWPGLALVTLRTNNKKTGSDRTQNIQQPTQRRLSDDNDEDAVDVGFGVQQQQQRQQHGKAIRDAWRAKSSARYASKWEPGGFYWLCWERARAWFITTSIKWCYVTCRPRAGVSIAVSASFVQTFCMLCTCIEYIL